MPPPGAPAASSRSSALRPVSSLWRDTFHTTGRCWRDLAAVAVLGAAFGLVSWLTSYAGLDALFDGQFWTKLDALNEGTIDTREEFDAWWASFDLTVTPQAISLLLVALVASIVGVIQFAASSNIAHGYITGGDHGSGPALSAGLGRMPVLMFIGVVATAAMALAAVIAVVFLVNTVALGVMWTIAVTAGLIVLGPLLTIFWVAAVIEPGLPSLRRWLSLIHGHKAAIWGRVMLVNLPGIALVMAASLSFTSSPLPTPYGDALTAVLISPVITAVLTVAYVLLYVDLARRSPSAAVVPDGTDS